MPPINEPIQPTQPDHSNQITEAINQPAPSPAPSPAPIVMGSDMSSGPGNNFGPSRKKKFLKFGLPILLVLLISAGVVFGWYLPNRPKTVYSTGLDRSGEVLDKLLSTVSDKESLKKIEKSDVTASLDASMGESKFTGKLNSKFGKDSSDGSLVVSNSKAAGKNLTINFKSETVKDQIMPNIYFQITGLKAIGLDGYFPSDKLEGKWYVIDKEFWDSIEQAGANVNIQDKQLTAEDYTGLSKAFAEVIKDRVFNSDEKVSIIKLKEFKGKEEVNGANAFHYTVGLNKANLDAFCQDAVDKISATSAVKKLLDKELEQAKKDNIKECQESAKNVKEEDTFDMWVDAKYKLISKIRVNDKQQKGAYTEFGQNYKGNDELSLFINSHENQSDLKSVFNTNVKTYVTNAKMEFVSTGDEKANVVITLDAKPYDGEINSKKPAGALPIKQLLDSLGYGELLNSDGTSSVAASSKDVERQTDIKALHGQLEAYFAQNGKYPTLAEVNSATWRKTNMRGLDDQALKDPDGTATTLAAKPAKNVYSYELTGDAYTLVATLSNGTQFKKASLN